MTAELTVQYGDVILRNCRIDEWQVEPMYDEHSSTDYISTRVNLSVVGLLLGVGPNLQSPPSPPHGITNPALDLLPLPERHQAVVHQLTIPRQTLQVLLFYNNETHKFLVIRPYVADAQSVERPPYETIDIHHGPIPRSATILHTALPGAVWVKFTVEAVILPEAEIANIFSTLGGVISHRWSVSEELNPDFRITKRVRGVLRVLGLRDRKPVSESDLQELLNQHPSAVPAQLRRHLCFPPLEPGFRFDRAEYTTTADGLTMEYDVTHVQVADVPPWPATRIVDARVENIMLPAGKLETRLTVALEGHPHTNRQLLIGTALRCIEMWLTPFRYEELETGRAKMLVQSLELSAEYGDDAIVNARLSIVGALTDIIQGGTKPKFLSYGTWDGVQLLNREVYSVNYAPIPHPYGGRPPLVQLWLNCYLQYPSTQHIYPHPDSRTLALDPSSPQTMPANIPLPDRSNPPLRGWSKTVPVEQVDVLPPWPHRPLAMAPSTATFYLLHDSRNIYHDRDGTILLPLYTPTENGDTTVALRLHAPRTARKIQWQAISVGRQPDRPPPFARDSDAVVTESVVEYASGQPAPGGSTYVWQSRGTMTVEYRKPQPAHIVHMHPDLAEPARPVSPFDHTSSSHLPT